MNDARPAAHEVQPGPCRGQELHAFDQLRLPDGLRLAFTQFGDQGGLPVVYHHGSPSSRIEAALLGDAAGRNRIRLISFDRPGVGRSDYRPRWTYPTLARDVAALADHLGIEHFGVLGWSGGGPPALACARLLPERVCRIVLAGAVPFGALRPRRVRRRVGLLKRVVGRCAWRYPRAMDWLVSPLGLVARGRPRRFVDAYAAKLGPADREVLDDPAFRPIVEADFVESFRQGMQGYAHDLDRLFSRWDFDPGGIELPVTIWQGTDDELVRTDLERVLAAKVVPTAELRLFEGEGHYLVVRHADQLFQLFRSAPAREVVT